mgnify:CR=1 FL=1
MIRRPEDVAKLEAELAELDARAEQLKEDKNSSENYIGEWEYIIARTNKILRLLGREDEGYAD